MKTKILILLLILINLFLLFLINSIRTEHYVQQIRSDYKLKSAYDYTSFLLYNEKVFDDIELHDSLINRYMLFMPEISCADCMDSIFFYMNKLCTKKHNLKTFIVSPNDQSQLRNYIKYYELDCPLYSGQQFSKYSKINYPLFAYYSESKELVNVVPIVREHFIFFKNYLHQIGEKTIVEKKINEIETKRPVMDSVESTHVVKTTVKVIKSVSDEEHVALKKNQKIDSIGIDMVFVKGGTMIMDSDEKNCSTKVVKNFKDFFIGKYEVTQEQWEKVMGNNSGNVKNKEMPINRVSYKEVQLFISKLNEITGKKYRLPSAAQWEYAARGGMDSKGFVYAGSNELDEVGWYAKNSSAKIHPVGQKKPNELGIYDMSGNVDELCSTIKAKSYNSQNYFVAVKGGNSVWRNDNSRNWSEVSKKFCITSLNTASVFTLNKFDWLGFRLILDAEMR